MFHVPNLYRLKTHPIYGSDPSFGNNGAFEVPLGSTVKAWVIASDGEGWEHVSVHIEDRKLNNGNGGERVPTWSEMCRIKSMFWDEDDCVIQFHPPKSEYVNCHKFTLHLWKPIGVEIPLPDHLLVGPKQLTP